MKRNYKQRNFFTIQCRECNTPVSTNSYRTLMCNPCSKYNDYKSNMLSYKWRLKKIWAGAKFRAKSKNLEFDITIDHLIDLWEASGSTCAVSNRKFDLTSYGDKGQVNPNAPSLDRIIPSKGYTIGNVRLVTYHTNVALSEYGLDALKNLASDIIAFR